MPTQPTYPGVYVEEIPSGVRPIAGAATSIAAFIGYFRRGPMDEAVRIFNMGDFEREFGGLDSLSEAGYAIQQFFLNGGTEAYVVRVASGTPQAAGVQISNNIPAGASALEIRAIHEGAWGNNIRIKIGHETEVENGFNMVVTEYDDSGTVALRQEVFRNLTMDDSLANIVNDENTGSAIVRVIGFEGTAPPAATGTMSGEHPDADNVVISGANPAVQVAVNGQTATATFSGAEFPGNFTLRKLALILENAIRSATPFNPLFACAQVNVIGNCLHIMAGGNMPQSIITFANHLDNTADELLLFADASANLQEYILGANIQPRIIEWGADTSYPVGALVHEPESGSFYRCVVPHLSGAFATDLAASRWEETGAGWAAGGNSYGAGDLVVESGRLYQCIQGHDSGAVFAHDLALGRWEEATDLAMAWATAQVEAMDGLDGIVPDGNALVGNYNNKTGMYALRDVGLFNILCIPRTGMADSNLPNPISDEEADEVISRAEAFCEERGAFYIIDTPEGIDDLPGIQNWIAGRGNLRSKNAALYYPRLYIPDPLNQNRLRSVGACGTIAGLYAKTDASRGVWKAPAGTEARLRNVPKVTDILTDQENGVLNQLGINCLRSFPVYGNICWGARTLEGADQMPSEWKYIPVRRFALFLEESLYQGLKWAVFEPNDEPLWAQIRLNVGAFMHGLFRQGAFQGITPREAYLVKCDKETTTQNDINKGIVNILVGFAPLKPAEFVFIRIQQLAGQIQS